MFEIIIKNPENTAQIWAKGDFNARDGFDFINNKLAEHGIGLHVGQRMWKNISQKIETPKSRPFLRFIEINYKSVAPTNHYCSDGGWLEQKKKKPDNPDENP
jgi:hypothetical protein